MNDFGSAGDNSENEHEGCTTTPQLFSQDELNDLVRDLNLSKQASELLAFRLKEKNCLKDNVKIAHYRRREKNLLLYFSQDEEFVRCNNISALVLQMGQPDYKKEDWRLFIDRSARSLKCVLLHNGNKFPSLPIAQR